MKTSSCMILLVVPMVALASGKPTVEEQVKSAELAFAETMAARDHAAFVTFLDSEAIFVGDGVLRGREEVASGWKPFFEAAEAPFSWEPELIQVIASGELALSSGPVRDASGASIGSFNSIWRRQSDGSWKVLFDKGCPPCRCPETSEVSE